MPIKSNPINVKNKTVSFVFPHEIELSHKHSLWDTDDFHLFTVDTPGCIWRIVQHHKKISFEELEGILKKNKKILKHGDILRSLKYLKDVVRKKENLVWIGD